MFNTVLNISRTQYPVRLTYVLTIHKYQGQILHRVFTVAVTDSVFIFGNGTGIGDCSGNGNVT